MDEILQNLWIGDILSTYNTKCIAENNIKQVITLMERPLPLWLRERFSELGIAHKAYEIDDDRLEDILSCLTEVCNLIKHRICLGQGVLVHCGLGVSRSGSMIVGYVMRNKRINREEALEVVRTKRKKVQPNEGFWEQLRIWESLEYEVWEVIGQSRIEKEQYREWKEEAAGKMKERYMDLM